MTWIEYIKQYMSGHPTAKWSEAMNRCKAPWAKYKEQQKLMPKYRGKIHIPGECVQHTKPAKLSKRQREIVKEECGMYKMKTKPKPYTSVKRKAS